MESVYIKSTQPNVIPRSLQGYLSPGDWSSFQMEVRKAKSSLSRKAFWVECGLCVGFGLFCSFCCHSCIEDIMDSGEIEGACNIVNGKNFGRAKIITHDKGILHINTSLLKSIPKQQTTTMSPMQQTQMMMQGQPQMIQQGQMQYAQPQMMQQGQPQMMVQGQPQMMQQGQFQMVQQGHPQMMQQGQPQMVQQGQPQMVQQGHPQMVQQGHPQMVQQGHPQMVQQGHPQMMQQGQPQMVQQGQPQMVQQGQPQYIQQGQPQVIQQGVPPLPSATVINTPPEQQPVEKPKYVEEEAPPQRQGQYVVSDASVVGTTVEVKTPHGVSVSIDVPANCPVGASINYNY